MFKNYCVNMVKTYPKYKHEIRMAILVISHSNGCLASHLPAIGTFYEQFYHWWYPSSLYCGMCESLQWTLPLNHLVKHSAHREGRDEGVFSVICKETLHEGEWFLTEQSQEKPQNLFLTETSKSFPHLQTILINKIRKKTDYQFFLRNV